MHHAGIVIDGVLRQLPTKKGSLQPCVLASFEVDQVAEQSAAAAAAANGSRASIHRRALDDCRWSRHWDSFLSHRLLSVG